MEQIFIQVAAYRDPCLMATIMTAFNKAKNPNRIKFGICLQDTRPVYKSIKRNLSKECSIDFVPYNKTQGIGWARQRAQSFYDGEQYELQIDSHMRFAQDWDEKVLQLWHNLPTQKAIITHYCPDWFKVPPEIVDKYPCAVCPGYFGTKHLPDLLGLWPTGKDCSGNAPPLQSVLSCHLIFTTPNFFEEVPIDPEIGFGYEEGAIALRSWTAGWDIYAPNVIIARHTWEKVMRRSTVWEDIPKEYAATKKVACRRWRRLCGINPKPITDEFGLGTKRTIEQYQKFSGINFKERTITHDATYGYVCLDYGE